MKPLWKFLDESIEKVGSSFNVNCEPSNFIEMYCREIHKQPDSSFCREQLLALCVDFFQAGSETTSNTLSFAILFMIHHQDVMRQIQKELDDVVGARFPAMTDRKDLIYTQATLSEIQRMANVAPIGKSA
jgi:methyl farnesoate epoxidase / farnesoate epoxidase